MTVIKMPTKMTTKKKKEICISECTLILGKIAQVVIDAEHDLRISTEDNEQGTICDFTIALANFIAERKELSVCLDPYCTSEHKHTHTH